MNDPLELPERDLDAWRREQIRRKAHAILTRPPGWLRVYDRIVEPGLSVAGGGALLVWAFLGVISLYA